MRRASSGLGATRPCRVVLVDRLSLMLRGIRAYLEGSPEVEVVGSAQTVESTRRIVLETRPDVLVIDPCLGETHDESVATEAAGLQLLEEIGAGETAPQIVVLTMSRSPRVMRRALDAGAVGYVLKDDCLDPLPQVLCDLWQRRTASYFSTKAMNLFAAAVVHKESAQATRWQFTTREREVLQLVISGKDTKQIAAMLGISARTVSTHRSRILRKADARSFFELIDHENEPD